MDGREEHKDEKARVPEVVTSELRPKDQERENLGIREVVCEKEQRPQTEKVKWLWVEDQRVKRT